MRITGGKARGIPLKVPPGNKVRPAMDAVREAVFSHLGDLTRQSRVLDLFAGCGAYGLEALSRGADSVDFVEKDARVRALLTANLAATHKSLASTSPSLVHGGDALAWKSPGLALYDLVFIDPPYILWETHGRDLLSLGASNLKHSPHSRLLIEAPGGWHEAPRADLRLVKELGKGKNQPVVRVFALANA